jgi:ABC-2 type transport system permease protein
MTARQLVAELRLVLRVLLRQPGFWVPTVLFPAMLYAFFGAGLAGTGPAAGYAMASFAIYAVLGVGFYQFGVTVAQDRADPFIRWQRLLPGSAVAPWVARVAAGIGFSAVAMALVLLLGKVLGGVVLSDAGAWLRLVAIALMAALPATLMGTALGSLASERAAAPLANLVFLPLAYLGGLWMPPQLLPETVAAISVWTPTRAMGELAWAALDGRSLPERYLAVLAVWTAIAALITWLAQTRQSKVDFG